VQVVGSVGAVKSGGHEKPMVQGEVVPALAKNARTGHPVLKRDKAKKGGPPARQIEKKLSGS